MAVPEKALGLRISKEFTKRQSLDCSDLRVMVASGTVYLNGRVKPIRGQLVDVRKEVEIVERNLRTIPGIRNVVNELDLRGL